MTSEIEPKFVRTIAERCRMCYTCVRECPAKAIRISSGQAEILPERCICCGNCVKVCSQGAKQIVSTVEQAEDLLAGACEVAACVAPSFPAEFADLEPERLVGMIRRLGFEYVNEVAFGADLVADRYHSLLKWNDGKRYIATSCPALVEFVERYRPSLVDRLAPLVSPMVAIARALRDVHGPALKTVFIGPCAAKKREAASGQVRGDVDAVLTFVELHQMFESRGLKPGDVEPAPFDPPRGGMGTLFPISRGLLQAADIEEDLLSDDVVATHGRESFVEALNEFESGAMEARLLESLCCHGCIMGPGMSTGSLPYERRSRVSRYARRHMTSRDVDEWRRWMRQFQDLDLSRTYRANDQRLLLGAEEQAVRDVLHRMGKFRAEDELNCSACGYDTCREHAVAILKGLAESEMCLPYTVETMRKAYEELAASSTQLASVRAALMQAEKLASMGQLAAGIAHEVNNPLGVVLLYSHLLLDEAQDQGLREDLQMIVEQADRCKKIVSGLLHFARQNKVVLKPTNLHALVAHALQAMNLPDRIRVELDADTQDATCEVDHDQIVQVMTNLINNAMDAMPDGGRLSIWFKCDEENVRLIVADTGIGIPEDKRGKIFEPFFTTKQMGKGTGLGLAVTYGIIKMHRGDISVDSNADPAAGPTGSTFTVRLPRKGVQDDVPPSPLKEEGGVRVGAP